MIAIELLLADEHGLMRAALREQFTQVTDLCIVTEATSLDEVLHLVQHQPPDVALIDIEMIGSPPVNVQQIGALCAATAVIFLSTQDWEIYLAFAAAIGACAFVCKTVTMDELVQIVRGCADAGPAFTPAQHQRIRVWQTEVEAKLHALTPRQHDVLKLLVAGYTNAEIAVALVVSVKTVESHVSQIFAKLVVNSRREVITWIKETRVALLWA